MGDRWTNLREALLLLEPGPGLRLLRCSRVYETEPWGVPEQPRFLNCAAEVAVSMQPEELLAQCKDVEERLGRVPGQRWGARLIDVDILLYGARVVQLPHLEIPHPRLHLRAFALIPLAELVPELAHPALGLTIGALAQAAEGTEGVSALGRISIALDDGDC